MFSCHIKKRESLVLALNIECLSWVDTLVQSAQGLLSGIGCRASWEHFTPWPWDNWWPLICGVFGKIYIGFKWETALTCCLSSWCKLFTDGFLFVHKWLQACRIGEVPVPSTAGASGGFQMPVLHRHWSLLCPRHWQLALARREVLVKEKSMLVFLPKEKYILIFSWNKSIVVLGSIWVFSIETISEQPWKHNRFSLKY